MADAAGTAPKKKTKRHASGVKAQRQSERHARVNRAAKKNIRLEIKAALAAAKAKDPVKTKELVSKAVSSLDKAAQKNVIHWKAAGRRKSQLARNAELLLAATATAA